MTRRRTFRVRAGGWGTTVLEGGSDGAPVVVLVHDGAYGTDADLCWGEVADGLSGDFHVLAPDLLGWGGSDKVNFFDRSPYDFRLEHLGALCRTLALDEPVHFAGVSFGAELVCRGAAQPRWRWPVRSAVSITGTGGRMFRVPGGIEQLSDYDPPTLDGARRITAMLVEDMAGLDDHVQRRFDNSLTPGHWEALTSLRMRNPAVERVIPPDDWPEPLRTCEAPILFVEGRSDVLLEQGWAAQMAEIAPNGESLVIQGGHEPNIDRPGDVVEAIGTFCSRL
ncbi:MAG TPA: alpha/beta hydrolase [Actinomycetota bacterium]|jgi:pimeloyl-ACP methyl ester carboxylesterase